ncbi:geranylgeranylglyceryl/heptaprenylglyceryl phosphate synthase [bacterium SCSIO 12741]|nr:geranylgeranylglyceryl/heptaprenylglyceryl phosphate synthase [bacterium SCSIO 12741]
MVLEGIQHNRKKGQKSLAVLIDPDHSDLPGLVERARLAKQSGVDYLFLGGSLVMGNETNEVAVTLKQHCDLPVILFPGSPMQICSEVDAVLFLSLISGRNPDYLIGNQVIAAPYIKKLGIETLPTGYMLVASDRETTATYISQTKPLPPHKPEIAAATAMAGEMLGLRMLYLDMGSGASNPVPSALISSVRKSVDIPLIVGGGIRTAEQLEEVYQAGADVAVVGNAIEHDHALIEELGAVKWNF